MAQMDLPLPEITKEDFLRAWTRFELVAAAKDWNAAKRATVLPTLLRGKLVDIYIELSEETRGDLAEVKKALMSKAGLTKDPLVAGKEFIARIQQDGEPVNTFASELKLLFSQAYPLEEPTSGILLQRFLTGLLPSLSRQVLLRGKPTSLEQAIKDAEEIEYALSFQTSVEQPKEINALPPQQGPTELEKLQETLEKMSKRLGELEISLKEKEKDSNYNRSQPPRGRSGRRPGRNPRQPSSQACWLCGELGHFQRDCYLNYSGPARPVGGWPQQ